MTQPKPEKKTLIGGAKAKLRRHFLANIGRVMDSDELRVVAEILAWLSFQPCLFSSLRCLLIRAPKK